MLQFLFRSNTAKNLLKIIYNIKNREVLIKKQSKYWIHKKKDNYLINFHPVLNFDKFQNAHKCFSKNYKPKNGDVIFDVGAGLGQEMVYFSKLIGERGKIFSIESDPRLFSVLRKLVHLNKLNNVYLFNAFFYTQNNTKITSKLSSINDWMSNSINKKKGKNLESKTITIDYLIKKYNIKKINFAKFNIEGSEVNLSKGNSLFLKLCMNITISCHDFLEGKNYQTFKIMKKILKEKKFQIIKNNPKNRIQKYFLYGKK